MSFVAHLALHSNFLKYDIYCYWYLFLGCGRLFSIDGNWKICYPHCMWQPSMTVASFSGALNYVNACPNQPEPGRVFCADHCQSAESKSVPTSLKEFTKYSKGMCVWTSRIKYCFIILLSSLWLHAQNFQIG